MKFDQATRRKLLFILILVMIAPFAVEVVLMAEIVGAEVAVMFLLLYLKDSWNGVIERWRGFQATLGEYIAIISCHSISSPRVFYVNTVLSVLLFSVTGSMFYLTAVWYPVAVFGGIAGPT